MKVAVFEYRAFQYGTVNFVNVFFLTLVNLFVLTYQAKSQVVVKASDFGVYRVTADTPAAFGHYPGESRFWSRWTSTIVYT
jgi:hypothetical protein